MKISAKGCYALCLLIDLARHPRDGYVSLQEIADRQSLPKSYLQQIVTMLTQSHLLKNNRGYQGGYMLSKKPDQYTLGEIFKVSETNLYTLEEASGSCNTTDSLVIQVWDGLNKAIADYLYGITLQDIIDNAAAGDNYCI